jgi:hypothetical protein
MGVEAGLGIEGKQPDATAAAIVVSPAAGDGAEQADGMKRAVAVEESGTLALRTRDARAYVTIFFSAR